MMVLAYLQEPLEYSAAFLTRNSFCYLALGTIRTDLETIISKIVTPHIGGFFAPIVSREFATVCSIPVTCFYGELVAVATVETIRSVIDIASTFFGYYKPKGFAPFFKEQALYIAGFAAGFFAKSYFCTFAMPNIHTATSGIIRHVSHLLGIPFPISSLLPQLAVITTPSITFLLGDIVWTVVSEITQEALDNIYDLVIGDELVIIEELDPD